MQKVMSALPSEADMCGATGDVRLGPQAAIAAPRAASNLKLQIYIATTRAHASKAHTNHQYHSVAADGCRPRPGGKCAKSARFKGGIFGVRYC
jgi:hypothetical protein